MKRIASVVAPILSVFLMPWACSGDPAPVGTQSGQGGGTSDGGSTSQGGDGTGASGGGTNACGADCEVQCDASLVPSQGECVTIGGPIQCNPVSNEGCNGPGGEVCDYGPGGFTCYPAPNEQEICEACSVGGNTCKERSTCTADGVCAKFCCTDGDCGGTGSCLIGAFNVGHCVKGSGGPAGSGGNGSGGNGNGGTPNQGSGGTPNGGNGGNPGGNGGNPGGNGGNPGGNGGIGGAGGN